MIRAALGGRPDGVQFFVSAPAEFERTRDDVGTLAYQIQREGRVLYYAPSVRNDDISAAPARISEHHRGPPRSLAAWIRRAENDFKAMEVLAASSTPVWDSICFHAHDGAEKLLKAALIATHTAPPRIHDQKQLLLMCPVAVRANTQAQAACRALDEVWPKSRYPDQDEGIPSPDDWDPTAEDAEKCVAAARTLRDVIMPVLERMQRYSDDSGS